MPTTIVIYRARDGLWAYCPSTMRHWSSFDCEGQFPNDAAALQAALSDPTIPNGTQFKVEK